MAPILAKNLHEYSWATADSRHRHVRPQCICYSTQCWNFLMKDAKFNIASNTSIDSVDYDVLFVEQISNEPSPQRNNSPNILTSTELSQTHTAGMPSVSSIASPEPQILTINDDSNEPTRPYGLGRQLPIVPPSLNDPKLTPKPFNVLATMAVVNHTEDSNDNNYTSKSPEPSEPSPILTPFNEFKHFRQLGDVSLDDRWQQVLFQWRAQENVFSSTKSFITPSAPRKMKRRLEMGMSFPKKGGVSQHIWEACCILFWLTVLICFQLPNY